MANHAAGLVAIQTTNSPQGENDVQETITLIPNATRETTLVIRELPQN